MFTKTKRKEILDQEWVSLMHVAKHLNLTPEEVRQFIRQASNSESDKKNQL